MWGEPSGSVGAGAVGRFQLPVGTVTFLLSDIEGSTRLWESDPDAMRIAVPKHYKILSEVAARHGGVRPVEQGEGDSIVAAFSCASDALAAALEAQRALHVQQWPEGIEFGVRIALHTAEAQLRDEGNFFGIALSRCARIRAIAHAGQILLSRATHDLVVDQLEDGMELVDCGLQRLRDLGRPEQVFALSHPDLPAEVRALRSLEAFPNNLPDQLTSFVGRDRELKEIREALAETRLLTLTGAGGAGKTRLALQSAADVLDRFPDGAWWVELAAVAMGELVAEELVAALGVRPRGGMTATEASCRHLCERRALVVLDNCEHVLAGCLELVERLLYECPQLRVLATSRTPLGVGGETDWRVPSLSLPPPEPAGELLELLGQSDAARLFIERARKARPTFAVNNDCAAAVAQICHALDGLPLAIELAAARVRMLSVDQIVKGLSDRFHLLTRGARTALPRHQTLRASVDWSHELLTEEERTLLRRLAVFQGGFTLDAVEDVCAGEELERSALLDLLSSLVDKSLVLAEEHGRTVRYRLLETIREYAAERLVDAGEEEALRDRHRDAYLDVAEDAAPHLAGRSEWLEMLDAEAANLDAALERALQTDAERALRMCAALFHWWRLRGLYAAAERGCRRAVDAAGGTVSVLRARVLCAHAYLLVVGGKHEAAIEHAQQALELAEEVVDQSAQARALSTLGMIQMHTDPVGNRPGLERACELARACGDDWCFVDARLNLSWSHQQVCDEHEAGERSRDGVLELAQRNGYRDYVSWYWLMECWRPLMRGEGERFRELVELALAAAREVGEPTSEATGEMWSAWLALEQGRIEDALTRVEASRERLLAAGAGLLLPYLEVTVAKVRAVLGDLDGARTILEPVVASGVDSGWGLGFASSTLADVLRVAGEAAGAEISARDALAIGERINSRQIIVWSKEVLALLAAERGDWGKAETLLHETLALRVEHELFLGLPRTLEALSGVAAGLDSHEEATRILGAAQRARDEMGLGRWALDQPRLEELESALRANLGDEGFATAQKAGASLTREDAIAWIRRARGERKRPARGWESLTPTELQVIELVSEGLTNPQIGERMFISRGTVKVHLSHIFAKLGTSTRAELAAEAIRRSQSPDVSPRVN
jgi:predicted ATPase/class 3 adenylate cyclase/DNA-binding CsgD family transcriptional regulator